MNFDINQKYKMKFILETEFSEYFQWIIKISEKKKNMRYLGRTM